MGDRTREQRGRWDRVAGVYNRLFGGWPLATGRRLAIETLAPRPDERILVSGCGPGFDLSRFPPDTCAVGADLARGMLRHAQRRLRCGALIQCDAQRLPFGAGLFDGVLLNLIVAVAPDGPQVLREALRVTRPGGRVVVFDKFSGPQCRMPLLPRLGRRGGTNFDCRLDEVLAAADGADVTADQPALLGGYFRVLRLEVDR